MPKNVRCIEVEGEKFFKEDIEKMTTEQLKDLMMFLQPKDFSWVVAWCSEKHKPTVESRMWELNMKL